MVDGKAQVKADNCVDCGVCVDACPVEAISL
jgi:NAD-dependent dihydropyrimidine dehydrogenase PreA subunit